MTIDNDVITRAFELGRRHGRRLVALTAGGLLLHWVMASPNPLRLIATVGALLLVDLAVLNPPIRHQPPPRVAPPVPPDDPSDEYAYLAYLESLILDTRAEMDERDETIDIVLTALQSSASGVACTAGRLRGRFDRGGVPSASS